MNEFAAQVLGVNEVAVWLREEYGTRFAARLLIRMRALGVTLQGIVKTDHLSGQDLHVRTGAGRRSVATQTVQYGSTVETRVGIFGGPTLPYMRAHEYGFNGVVTVRAHTRRVAQARRATLRRIAKRVPNDPYAQDAPNAVHTVREHSRRMKISAKAYLRRALAAFRPKVEQGVADVVGEVGRA